MVAAVDTVASTQRVSTGRATLMTNYETFLSLLTAQLRNQDPLSPVDSNQFTAQLVQMAGVEQQLLTNDLLTALLNQNQETSLVNATQFMGRDVTAVWNTTKLDGGQASWSYELGRQASGARLEIVNAQGSVVWSGQAPNTAEGLHDFTWNGRDNAGNQLADGGIYTLRIAATDSTGASVPAQILMRGRVTGVELYQGQPYLTLGATTLPLSSVIALDEARAASAGTGTNNDNDDEGGLLSSIAARLNPLNLF